MAREKIFGLIIKKYILMSQHRKNHKECDKIYYYFIDIILYLMNYTEMKIYKYYIIEK